MRLGLGFALSFQPRPPHESFPLSLIKKRSTTTADIMSSKRDRCPSAVTLKSAADEAATKKKAFDDAKRKLDKAKEKNKPADKIEELQTEYAKKKTAYDDAEKESTRLQELQRKYTENQSTSKNGPKTSAAKSSSKNPVQKPTPKPDRDSSDDDSQKDKETDQEDELQEDEPEEEQEEDCGTYIMMICAKRRGEIITYIVLDPTPRPGRGRKGIVLSDDDEEDGRSRCNISTTSFLVAEPS